MGTQRGTNRILPPSGALGGRYRPSGASGDASSPASGRAFRAAAKIRSRLSCDTLPAPLKHRETADRDTPGEGFTHKIGDRVEISTPKLGKLINWVNHTDRVPPWTFGAGALMRNLAGRGLL